MTYKSILTILTNATDAMLSISAAAKLAQSQDAHLDVLVLWVDRSQVGYSYIGTGAVLMQAALDRAETEAKETEAAAKTAISAQFPSLRWSSESLVVQVGALNEVVSSRARFADLVVLPRPYGTGRGSDSEAALEAALFEDRAPVLIVPDAGLAPNGIDAKRVVLAWDQSAEAMLAARHALPILKAAEIVDITIIDPPSHGANRSDPGGYLAQYLVRHGVHAEVSVLARSTPKVADILLQHMRDKGADLLVMGAYGHSRLREAILGGATRNMLEQAETPVLMAH